MLLLLLEKSKLHDPSFLSVCSLIDLLNSMVKLEAYGL